MKPCHKASAAGWWAGSGWGQRSGMKGWGLPPGRDAPGQSVMKRGLYWCTKFADPDPHSLQLVSEQSVNSYPPTHPGTCGSVTWFLVLSSKKELISGRAPLGTCNGDLAQRLIFLHPVQSARFLPWIALQLGPLCCCVTSPSAQEGPQVPVSLAPLPSVWRGH